VPGVCPVGAISLAKGRGVRLDLGRCLFCGDCVAACPHGAISRTNDHRLAVRRREDLILGAPGQEELRLAQALDKKMKSLLGRSLRLRQVSAGGCNACEADINVLGTIGWDLGRFGIQYVASPRHADGVLITGPVTKGMELALQKTWEAVPEPRIAIALGACAISGGPFVGHAQHNGGAEPHHPHRPLHPRLPPAPPDHPGRLPAPAGPPAQTQPLAGRPKTATCCVSEIQTAYVCLNTLRGLDFSASLHLTIFERPADTD
jgi:Ni,Fe-hydrogenase III small subunit